MECRLKEKSGVQAEGLSKKHEGLVEMRFYVPDTELVDEDAMDDVQREKTVDHLYAQVLCLALAVLAVLAVLGAPALDATLPRVYCPS